MASAASFRRIPPARYSLRNTITILCLTARNSSSRISTTAWPRSFRIRRRGASISIRVFITLKKSNHGLTTASICQAEPRRNSGMRMHISRQRFWVTPPLSKSTTANLALERRAMYTSSISTGRMSAKEDARSS